MTKDEALKMALESLENSIDLVSNDAREAELLYGKYQSRLAQVKKLVALEVAHGKAITAIKEALAQPEQEPIGYLSVGGAERLVTKKQTHEQIRNFRLFANDVFVYTTPPRRTWVGLTDDEKQEAYLKIDAWNNCVNWIESTLREKNK